MKRLYRMGGDVVLLLLLFALPLAGVVAAGRPVGVYLEFPPLTGYVEHAGFAWPVFLVLAAAILATVAPFVIHVLRSRSTIPRSAFAVPRSPLPWWGWCGVALTGVAWLLAWTRFPWMAKLQAFTFTPVWCGYILVVNGLAFRRTGHCLLRDRPTRFLGLFVVSAFFWWYFEYLNRFVQNWHYVGIGGLSRMQYVVFATLPFSTVLPAVLSTHELLASFPRISAGLEAGIKIPIAHLRVFAWGVFVVFGVSLGAIGVWPDALFPLLWLSPLCILTALQAVRGEKTIFSGIAQGHWRDICLLALAALICGFFWELWNYRSLAKWVYAVPYVNRFKLFEMPILGYAGYLPFGIECAVVAQMFGLSAGTLGRNACCAGQARSA